jgi:serine/threonine protein kinase
LPGYIWDLVAQIRTILRPEHLSTYFYCTADGSPAIRCSVVPPIELHHFLDDKTFRDSIYERYVAHNGLTYRDSTKVPDLLPRSDTSVFTHGDIGPRNIMVDANGHILSLLDWKFAQMMKHSHDDWQVLNPSRGTLLVFARHGAFCFEVSKIWRLHEIWKKSFRYSTTAPSFVLWASNATSNHRTRKMRTHHCGLLGD